MTPPQPLHILSGGAAQGLVAEVAPKFLAQVGYGLRTTFGAVGAMREKLLAGELCDVLIVTEAMLNELARGKHVIGETIRALGRVRTGIAVRSGDARPDIGDGLALQSSLRAASEIYLPDPQRATAGIHFAQVLERLGLGEELKARLRPHSNGAEAMRALAESKSTQPIGCTQVTEIKYAQGVALVGPLPAGFELATVYSAGVSSGARQPEPARQFVRVLSEPQQAGARADAGFEV